MRGDLITLEICREFGWTYYEYLAQPHWFTELAIKQRIIDSQKANARRNAVE